LQVIDISDPTNPAYAGSYDTPGSARGIAIAGDRAYVADGSLGGLQVIDISDPTNPVAAGAWAGPYATLGVALSGDYAYVAEGDSGLQVIDISDPTNPTSAGGYDTPHSAEAVAISGDYAYIADRMSGLQAIDISDPGNPALAGSLDTPGMASGVALTGNHAYVSDSASGLQVIAISNPMNPAPAGEHISSNDVYYLDISGDYAYVCDDWNLHIMDISNPVSPVSVASYEATSIAEGVVVSGDYAYFVSEDDGLQVIDISDPETPFLAGNCAIGDYTMDVAVSGDQAYAVNIDGLHSVDVSDPLNPAVVGSYITSGSGTAVAVSGDYAYVADYYSGVKVIDVSDPTNITLEGECNTPGAASDVAISGDFVYVADKSSGLQVIRVSIPSNPLLVASCATPGTVYSVVISGDYAFVADGSSGLQVIDISDPYDPILVGGFDTPGFAYGLTLSGDYAYVADWDGGLQIFQVFQRSFEIGSNEARSLIVDSSDDTILAARLSTAQTDSITWELSADGGSSWQEFWPGGAYQNFAVSGSDLVWRSLHVYRASHPTINPTCTDLEVEWLYGYPVIESITDIGNDQGGQLSLSWARSSHDFVGSATPIVEYAVYRKIDGNLQSPPESKAKAVCGQLSGARRNSPQTMLLYPPGDWHFLMTVPADAEDEYAVVVSTLADSTIAEGMYYTTYFVRARTATPGVYFDSYPDSGYSVDNLAPAPPPNLRMTTPDEIAWDEAPEHDFNYFSVYGSEASVLDETAVLISHTIALIMDVSEDNHLHYHVTATDFSGNEGNPSSIENTYAGLPMDEDLPAAYALRQNQPNPFKASTVIAFDLPQPGVVTLRVFDVNGRLVKNLVGGMRPAGRHSVIWDGCDEGGGEAGPGIYFARIEASGFEAITKMLITR
jgi:hypothetical protein